MSRNSSAPPWPELHAKKQSLETASDAKYWRKLCPSLSIRSTLSPSDVNLIFESFDRMEKRKNLTESGYFRTSLNFKDKSFHDKLYQGMQMLKMHGWPPHFICMFDEVWLLALLLQEYLIKQTVSGSGKNDFVFNMDFMASFVDPIPGNSCSIPPHRDRVPENVKDSFYPDKTPKSVTCWFPLTNATPQNGCLYCIPKYSDPGYSEGDSAKIDPILRALSTNSNASLIQKDPFPEKNYSAFQNIRALNVDKGDCLVYSHRLMHWGGRVEEGASTPLTALAFSFSDIKFEVPYIKGFEKGKKVPSIKQRLCLAAAQGILHHKQLDLEEYHVTLISQIFAKFYNELEEAFVRKVIELPERYEPMPVKKTLDPIASLIAKKETNFIKQNPIENNKELNLLNKLFTDAEISDDERVMAAELQKSLKKESNGFGIFKDIFKKNGDKSSSNSSKNTSPETTVPSLSFKEDIMRSPPVSSSPSPKSIDENSSSTSPLKQKTTQTIITKKKNSNIASEGKPVSNRDESKEKPFMKRLQKLQETFLRGNSDSMLTIKVMCSDDEDIPEEALNELLQHRKLLEEELESVPSILNASREERAKHLFSIFFNDDGTQKITGSDLRNVVPIVCPDYSAVQRMAQGFFGNAKEFENQGDMFGSIAVDLIQNVPAFHAIPEDFCVLQSSSRRVGIKLLDNHLKSIGQAFNIFLREACYTYLLFFRTIIPTMVSHCLANPMHKDSFDSTLHSRKIQQDFQTTLSVLKALHPLGPLYTDPIVDVVETLLDAAREVSSPVLLTDACHLISACTPPKEKVGSWLVILENIIRGLPKTSDSYIHDSLQSALKRCKSVISEKTTEDCAKFEEWKKKLAEMPVPPAEELVSVILHTINDSTLNHKVQYVSRLNIKDVKTLRKVTEIIHERSLLMSDRSDLMAGFCVRLAYRLPDFSADHVSKLLKQLRTKNRAKVQKRALFTRFLLRQCQSEFFKEPPSQPQKKDAKSEINFEEEMQKYRRRRIRNVRLITFLTRLGMFSHTLIMKCILPHLLDESKSINVLDIECAIVCLKMTGKALDKGYREQMDKFINRLKHVSTLNILDDIAKDNIAYLLFRRDHNWKDSESFYSSESE